MREPVFGAVAIARMFGVSRITIHQWIKAGKIRAHRTPGRHYRVMRSDLVAFLDQAGLSLPEALQPGQRPQGVWVGGDGRLLDAVLQAATAGDAGAQAPWAMTHVADPWAAMIRIGRLAPTLVALDPALDDGTAAALCDAVAAECPDSTLLYALRPGGDTAGGNGGWMAFEGSLRSGAPRWVSLAEAVCDLDRLAGR